MLKYLVAVISYLRLLVMRLKGVDVTFHPIQSISFLSSTSLQKGARFSLGRNVQISRFVDIFVSGVAELNIGSSVYFGPGCIISVQESVSIGDNVLFGPDVKIFDNNHVFNTEVGAVPGAFRASKIVIGKSTWIGANVVILKGVVIGDGCVIGAGCIVDRNIPDHSIVKTGRDLSIKSLN